MADLCIRGVNVQKGIQWGELVRCKRLETQELEHCGWQQRIEVA